MRRFITPEYLCDPNYNDTLYSHVASRSLKRWIITPTYHSNILETIRRNNFEIHPSRSFLISITDTDFEDSRSLQMFWQGENLYVDSQATVSMETESRASASSLQTLVMEGASRELRTTAQQTEISCPHEPGELNTTDLPADQDDLLGDPPLVSRPNIPQQNGQISILGSVCALLLQKHVQQNGSKGAEDSPPDTICRICFGGESAERLVQPCSCRGTIAAVHRTCLERWLLQAATSYCELCRYHYVVTRTHKWSLVRSVAEWARSGRGRALAADVWRGAALGAASVLGTARALHACDRLLQAGARRGGSTALVANLTSSVLIGLIGALNGLLTTWMLLKIQEHQISWQTWRDSTLHVRVTLTAAAAADASGAAAAPPPAPDAAADELPGDPSLLSIVARAQP